MGIFDKPLFDFNGDGKVDAFEFFAGMQMCASSRKEAIELTGDDTFYMGNDTLEDERREALEDAGLDPDDYDEF